MKKHIFEAKTRGKISQIDDKTLQITLSSGKIDKNEAYFLTDDAQNEFVIFPQQILKDVISIIKRAHEMRLQAELERDVMSFMPVDFDDVMVVATQKMEKLRDEDGKLPKIDTTALIREIKKEHPNLF